MKYAFIKAHRKEHKVIRLCEVLAVSTSSYYAWLDRPEGDLARENRRLTDKIVKFHQTCREIYGSPRTHKDLIEDGETCGVSRVARLMKVHNFQSKMARKFVITANSKNTHAPAPDLLKRRFWAEHRDERWASDTTFIGTRQCWLYLAIVLELYSRQVIGWSISKKNDNQLVMDALMMALWRRGEVNGVMLHSDQGSTYAQETISNYSLIISYSAV